MEGSAPDTPTIDALISEVQALAQHAGDALRGNPRVQEIVAQIEAVEAAIESARADAQDDGQDEAPAE